MHPLLAYDGRFGSWPRDNALEGCQPDLIGGMRRKAPVSMIFFRFRS